MSFFQLLMLGFWIIKIMNKDGVNFVLENLYSLLLKSLLYIDEDVNVKGREFGEKL